MHLAFSARRHHCPVLEYRWENGERKGVTVTPPLFAFSGSQTPHSQCKYYNKELLAEEAIMRQSGEGVHNLRG